MSLNSFGHMFRMTTWGESHGPALGAVVDGCPPGVRAGRGDDPALAGPAQTRAKPKFTTQRREADEVRILSGVFEGQTTGTPISLMIENTDQRSKDYSDIAERFRPGHADITYWQKYGIRDYRGGGRSSARETAARVAAGGVAREVLKALLPGIEHHRLHGADGGEEHRPRPLRSGRDRAQSVLGARCAGRRRLGRVSRRPAQGRQFGRRGDRGGGFGRARGAGRADLRQARRRTRRGDDVDQCGEGRRDRRRHGRGGTDRHRERRRDLHGQRRQTGVFLEPCRRRAGRDLVGAGRGGALRGQADLVDPHARAAPSTSTATRPRSSPRAATTPASASARCRWARR